MEKPRSTAPQSLALLLDHCYSACASNERLPFIGQVIRSVWMTQFTSPFCNFQTVSERWPCHHKSKRSKLDDSFFTNIRCINTLYHIWHQSWPSQTTKMQIWLCDVREFMRRSQRSPKCLFANSFTYKLATALCIASLCSAHQHAQNHICFDPGGHVRVTWPDVNSFFTLTLGGHLIIIYI